MHRRAALNDTDGAFDAASTRPLAGQWPCTTGGGRRNDPGRLGRITSPRRAGRGRRRVDRPTQPQPRDCERRPDPHEPDELGRLVVSRHRTERLPRGTAQWPVPRLRVLPVVSGDCPPAVAGDAGVRRADRGGARERAIRGGAVAPLPVHDRGSRRGAGALVGGAALRIPVQLGLLDGLRREPVPRAQPWIPPRRRTRPGRVGQRPGRPRGPDSPAGAAADRAAGPHPVAPLSRIGGRSPGWPSFRWEPRSSWRTWPD